MATQALYRAWRPARFSDVVGQDAVVTTLRNQIASGRVAHAYLFCGSRGTGKTTSAKILARAVNCQSPENGDPCGKCPVCRALESETSLDVLEIDAASNNGVDEIRDLREKVKYPPQHGRYRVYIIDEVHMLSSGAFNALLKTLEEPPGHALFILATTEPQRLPPTVLSRCQRYDFRRIPAEVIAGRMRTVIEGERADVSPEALLLIARAAEGGLRDALSLLDMCLAYGGGSADAGLVREVLGAADRGFLFAFARHLLDGDAAAALCGVDALMRSGREPQVFCRDVSWHLRALLLAKTCGEEALPRLLETTFEDAAQYAAQAKEASRERLLELLDLFLASETDMRWSSQPRIALEMAAARACLPRGGQRLEALAARLDLVEKKLDAIPSRHAPAESVPEPLPAKPGIPEGAGGAAQGPAEGGQKKSAPLPDAAQAPEGAGKPAAGDNGKAIWEAALKQIRKEPSLYASMLQGKFEGIVGDTAHMSFQKAGEIYLNMLRQADRQAKVEAILSGCAGRPIALSLTLASDPQAGASGQRDTLRRVFEVFGRENVQVVDED